MARSRPQRYTPKNAETRITTTVVAYTSRREGHVTRRISLRTSVKNVRVFDSQPVLLSPAVFTCSIVVLIESIPGLPRSPTSAAMAGQEGLEPPTPGFGDRCSTN